MLNLSSFTRKLYSLSLFNHKNLTEVVSHPRLILTCSLIQKGMHKKNLFNFIFFLYLITKLKPKLRTARASNALLNVRKGSLVEGYVSIKKLKNLENIFSFLNFEKDFLIKLKNEVLLCNKIKKNTYKFNLDIIPKNSHHWSVMFAQKFKVKFIFNFSTFCTKRQIFLSSLF